MIINVILQGDKALLSKLTKVSAAVDAALKTKITALTLKLERKVKTEKLNGQVLNRITGALMRSIQSKIEASAKGIYGIVYSAGDVKYAAIHEYGGTTSPHIIEPKKAQALAFLGAGGGMVFAKRVNHPGSKIPERSFLRSSLTEMSKQISLEMKEAAIEAVRKQIRPA